MLPKHLWWRKPRFFLYGFFDGALKGCRFLCKFSGIMDYLCVMRKFLMLLICLVCSATAFAQKTQEVFLSIGVLPYDEMTIETPYGYYDNILDLYDAYETQFRNGSYSALINLEYHKFLSKRISLGACASYGFGDADLYDPLEDVIIGKRSVNNLYLLARFRYCYQHSERGELYSGVSAGTKLSYITDPGQQKSFKAGLAGELVLIGLSYGKKIPVYAELVIGNTQAPYRFGIGYKF